MEERNEQGQQDDDLLLRIEIRRTPSDPEMRMVGLTIAEDMEVGDALKGLEMACSYLHDEGRRRIARAN